MGHYSTRTQTETDAILVLATDMMKAKMDAREPFTSLDISNGLKAKNFPVRHREVSAVVRGLYAGGGMNAYGYTRTLILVSASDGSAQAYLYHHQTQQPSDYDKDAQTTLPRVAGDRARALDDAVPAGVPLTTLAETALLGMVGSAVINGNGRVVGKNGSRRRVRGSFRRDGAVSVPRSIIEKAGYQEGDLLILTHDPITDSLTLQAAPAGNTGVIGTFVKVWSDLRVRISKTKWRIAGFATVAFSPGHKPNFALDGRGLRIVP